MSRHASEVLWTKRDNGYWYYRLRGEKTFHSTGKKTRVEAEAVVDSIRQVGKDSMMLFGDYARGFFDWETSLWIKRQHAKGKSFSRESAHNNESALRNHIEPKWGKTQMRNITAVDVENWLVKLKRSNSGKNSLTIAMRMIFKEAKREKIVVYNPLNDVEPFAAISEPKRLFSEADYAALFPYWDEEKMIDVWKYGGQEDHAPPAAALRRMAIMYGSGFFLMATTGIRSGELRGLMWKHVLWPFDSVVIEQSIKHLGGYGSTKSGSVQPVPLYPPVKSFLARWRDATPFPENDHFILFGGSRQKTGDRLCSDDSQNILTSASLEKRLQMALRNIGFGEEAKQYTPHCFRHTVNTWAGTRGMTGDAIRLLMRHKSEAMTGMYDHPTMEAKIERLEDARGSMQDVFFGDKTSKEADRVD